MAEMYRNWDYPENKKIELLELRLIVEQIIEKFKSFLHELNFFIMKRSSKISDHLL